MISVPFQSLPRQINVLRLGGWSQSFGDLPELPGSGHEGLERGERGALGDCTYLHVYPQERRRTRWLGSERWGAEVQQQIVKNRWGKTSQEWFVLSGEKWELPHMLDILLYAKGIRLLDCFQEKQQRLDHVCACMYFEKRPLISQAGLKLVPSWGRHWMSGPSAASCSVLGFLACITTTPGLCGVGIKARASCVRVKSSTNGAISPAWLHFYVV